MKIDQIKKKFPIFDEKIQNNDLVYLDRANSSQKPKINFEEINEFGEVPIENIEKLITAKTKIIAVNHLSNVTGAILPIKEITELAHAKGIIVVVDGCQGAPHLKIDVQDLDCDFYAISCHKMYGPTGLGILYGKKKWLEELPPYQ